MSFSSSTQFNYQPLIDTGQEWGFFKLTEDNKLSHCIPNEAFLDQPVLKPKDREVIDTPQDSSLENFFWRYQSLREQQGRVTYAVADQDLAVEPGTTKTQLTAYERGRLALSDWVTVEPIDIPEDEDDAYGLWQREVEEKAGVGFLTDKPLWTDLDHKVPLDQTGTPMHLIGQFKADNITSYVPGFIFWLYWSPTTHTFTQVSSHD